MSSITDQIIASKLNGTLAHAYIVSTDTHDMVRFLRSCAKAIMCDNNGCGTCSVCQKIDNSVHGDVLQFPSGKNIKVDDISLLVSESFMRPVDSSSRRVFLVDATNSLTTVTSAVWQNKLLKTLEEPTKGVHIIIGVNSLSGLLPTVVSRCQVLYNDSLSYSEVLTKVLEQYVPEVARVAAAISSSDVDKALSLAGDSSVMEMFDFVVDMLVNMKSTKDSLSYATTLERYKDKYSLLFTIISSVIRDRIMWSCNSSMALLGLDDNCMMKIASNYSLHASSQVIQLINNANTSIAGGANYTLVIDKLLANILEAKYTCRQ